jgi:hypothetical protein
MFVRDGHWLLVVNEASVLGAYDYDTKEIYGQWESGKFPYSAWTGQGKVVVERRWRRPDSR